MIDAIDIAMIFAILKARLSSKSVPGFEKKCKEIQIKGRKLKNIWKKVETKKSQKDLWIAWIEKSQVIAKAKRKVYHKLKEKEYALFESM